MIKLRHEILDEDSFGIYHLRRELQDDRSEIFDLPMLNEFSFESIQLAAPQLRANDDAPHYQKKPALDC